MPTLIILSALILLRLHQIHRANADSSCPKNCRPYEVEIHCNKTTGECSEGCKTGFYGLTCDKTCCCGGGACAVTDGSCMTTPSVKPEPISPGHQTQDCRIDGFVAGICVLCAVVVVLIVVVAFLIVKFRRFSKRSNQPQSYRPEDQHMLTDNCQTRPPIALPESQRKVLQEKLGVHFLNPEALDPLVLICARMKFDYQRVNREKSHLMRGFILSNEPRETLGKEFPLSFKNFHGTTSLSPIYHTGSPTYFEVLAGVSLNENLRDTDLLLSIGLCRETQRDEWYQIRLDNHCYSLNVCVSNNRICTQIYRDKKWEGIKHETDLGNKQGESGSLHYGLLVYKDKKAIMFFDITKMHLLTCFVGVDFEEMDPEGPLWPMFGVYNGSKAKVTLDLKTGRYVDMTPAKRGMILSACKQ